MTLYYRFKNCDRWAFSRLKSAFLRDGATRAVLALWEACRKKGADDLGRLALADACEEAGHADLARWLRRSMTCKPPRWSAPIRKWKRAAKRKADGR